MRGSFLGEIRPVGLDVGLSGGVAKRSSLDVFRGFISDGELVSVSICAATGIT